MILKRIFKNDFENLTGLKYKKIRDEKMAQKIYQQDLLDDAFKPKNDMLTVPTKNIPSVADVIGKTLPLIGKYNDLGCYGYT